MTEQHQWTLEEDKVALYLYKHCYERYGKLDLLLLKLVASILAVDEGVLKAKIDNYKYLDQGRGKSPEISEQERELNKSYGQVKRVEFREEVVNILTGKKAAPKTAPKAEVVKAAVVSKETIKEAAAPKAAAPKKVAAPKAAADIAEVAPKAPAKKAAPKKAAVLKEE
jgi:hypothetical protein